MIVRIRCGLAYLCKIMDSCSPLGMGFFHYADSVALTHTHSRSLRVMTMAMTTTNHHHHNPTTSSPDMGMGMGIYTYNTSIKSLSRHPHSAKHAIRLYNDIQAVAGLRPDTYSFPFVLKAVVCLSSLHVGTQIHCQAIVLGMSGEVHVSTALIRMYASCGGTPAISNARKVFDEMRLRDVASWNAIIASYTKVGHVETACDLFDSMPERNVISWTCVIAGYAQADRPNEAIFFFRRMLLEGVEPDEVAMLAVLSACAQLGTLELGEWIHYYINKHRLRKTLPLHNALIDMYAKSGNIRKALEIFENMNKKSVITWTTIIGGLALHGLGREALTMFSRMERDQIRPNEITFIAILSACSHVGLVEVGRWFFAIMESRYGIQPKIEHYGCMIDLLGRSGCLKEAEELVNNMPFEANGAIWGSLLAASRTHSDVELAELSLQHLILVEPQNSGNYMLLSNTYAALGWWNESGMMRKVMKDAGVKKVQGASSIEVNNRLHEFSSGDKSHPQFEKINSILSKITEQLSIMREELLVPA